MEEAYYIINADAADIANADSRLLDTMGNIGQFFTPAPGERLALDYQPDLLNATIQARGLNQVDVELILVDVVKDALYKALHRQPGMLGGIIMEHLRNAAS